MVQILAKKNRATLNRTLLDLKIEKSSLTLVGLDGDRNIPGSFPCGGRRGFHRP